MHKARLQYRNDYVLKETSDYVIYWMQHTQRISNNYALKHAVDYANKHKKILKVVFVFTPDYKEANLRHYTFMVEGLWELRSRFKKLNIDYHIEIGQFAEVLQTYIPQAALLIMDDAYLKPLVDIKKTIVDIASSNQVPVVQVINDVIIPVDYVSQKVEYSARTIRKKLQQNVDDFLDDVTIAKVTKGSTEIINNPSKEALLSHVEDTSIKATAYFKGGESEAFKRLAVFLDDKLSNYDQSNDPSTDLSSTLSPYLHFGQIAPVDVYLAIQAHIDTHPLQSEAFLEQLLVRRELAFNFVTYQPHYDDFNHMTYTWAYETMKVHKDDTRPVLYTKEDYINQNTHDPYFNAAMKEMVVTGYMHNYMRMYWGKKIIEWSPDYATAYTTIKTLNNAYFLDGRDPVSYASIAWLFGRHDRGWKSREIFGKLRYMNANGLKRKFDIETYVEKMNALKNLG